MTYTGAVQMVVYQEYFGYIYIMRVGFVLFIMLLSSGSLFAQGEGNNWLFSSIYHLNFNNDTVTLITDTTNSLNPNDYYIRASHTAISDCKGNLLFYVGEDTITGLAIRDKNYNIMPNGSAMLNNNDNGQGELIIPNPGNENQYFVFIDGPGGLSYSIVDMSLNGGLGDVTAVKNIILYSSSTRGIITGTKHSNKQDFWLIAIDSISNALLSFQITPAGINTPLINNVINSSFVIDPFFSKCRFTSQGDKFAISVSSYMSSSIDSVFIFQFVNGIFNNPIKFGIGSFSWGGMEFSPNGNLLYISTYSIFSNVNNIWQYDLSSWNSFTIGNSGSIISGPYPWPEYGLQLAPDGQIYTYTGSNSMHKYLNTIKNPDIIGIGCNYQDSTILITGNSWGNSFINMLSSWFDPEPYFIKSDSTCLGSPTNFSLNDTVRLDSVSWSFGDAMANGADTSTALFPAYTYPSPGTYIVQAIAHYRCITDTLTDTVEIAPAFTLSLPADTLMCGNNNIILDASQPVPVSYLWQDSSTTATHTATSPGMYWVAVSNACKTVRDTIIISQDSIPVVALGADTTLCEGDIFHLDASFPGAAYQWNTGSTDSVIAIDSAGIYIVTAGNGCGSASDSIAIAYLSPPAVDLGNDTTICEQDVLLLTATHEWAAYLWQDNSTDSIFSASAAGEYWVVVSNQCGSARDSITIATLAVPQVDLGPDRSACDGEEIILAATNPQAQYYWNSGHTDSTLTVTTSGYFTVEVSNICGQAADSINVVFYPVPEVDLGPDTLICSNEEIMLDGGSAGIYLWQDGSSQQYHTATGTGIYHVLATDPNGCTAEDSIMIGEGICPVALYLPNAFSPNGDGINDIFKAQGSEITYFRLSIYNRWGEKIFESSDLSHGWDGTYRGNPVPLGSYMYHVTWQGKGDNRETKGGSVMLLR